ncbi:peptidase family T4 protein [Cordyceps fumosorosea ARSEF 2679]|uniref:Peptidase family T4 protein n=1 Tax=Cordyceps fumosorosea (strain ARSEF 2679) TaxID=1081104 RepID=A0A167VSI1_CORFA|nr:peptidase family T4 protein [Cordyceps fumosorosea ARSEF 2679]OAA62936.1 peptidase family T4 protein [Cordyceps fumosorosea ARSEF 2679]
MVIIRTETKPNAARMRVREAIPGLRLGNFKPGKLNSITDVPGVLVDVITIRSQDKHVNTGLTTILPRRDWYKYCCFAGVFRFNGCGELTGSHWMDETGLLTSPILLTSTGSVGDSYRGIYEYCYRFHQDVEGEMPLFIVPVVAETYDGYLSDLSRFPLTAQHVIDGIKNASSKAVAEGCTGGGTGMVCHRFKAGTGCSSRVVSGFDESGNEVDYTVGVLVQANYGGPQSFHVGGVPVGAIIKEEQDAAEKKRDEEAEKSEKEVRKDGSIIIVIATDAPLLPVQLQRLAKRATVGLAKVGGYGNNTSGDIFLAFSTASKIPYQEVSMSGHASRTVDPLRPSPMSVQMTDNDSINGLFEAAADATEEAIYNSIFMGTTMTGFKGRTVPAVDIGKIKAIVEKRL